METTKCTVVGVFEDYETAERVASELEEKGYGRNEMTISGRDASDAALGGSGLSGREHHDQSGGGISGFFHRLFGSDVDDDTREHYSEAVRRGGAVVTVRTTDDRSDKVRDIMDRYDPIDLDQRVESWRDSGYRPAREAARNTDTSTGRERTIPVIEEELQVGKRMVQRGGVRVYSRLSEQPAEEQVRLREERVRVERRPADRVATEADFRGSEQVIEVTEMAEEPVIGKRARVVEDVVIGKEMAERTETVREHVRRSDVNVDRLEGSAVPDYDDDAYAYGSALADNDRYRGRTWDDIEPDVQRDYERRYPENTWERMKDSIRQGWDKVTGER